MVFKRILFSAYTGFAVAMFASLLFGRGGIFDHTRLSEYQITLEQNLTELKTINQDLASDLKNLSSNPETLRQQARSLGYYGEDERVIRIQGVTLHNTTKQIGSVLRRNDLDKAQPVIFHIVGITAGIAAFAVWTWLSRRHET
ncbi:MAG: septum formation initiator family protein [Spirochaetaceae bacterium]|nr:MAG: septum formation initiator family protein [Spirochaetaceae bacterium]